MLAPTAIIQATVEVASKYSTRVIRVSRLTSTPEAPTRANFQKRPAEGTYQKRLIMCARYSKPCRRVTLETLALRAWKEVQRHLGHPQLRGTDQDLEQYLEPRR